MIPFDDSCESNNDTKFEEYLKSMYDDDECVDSSDEYIELDSWMEDVLLDLVLDY
jgi:hypothetical protein